MKAIIALQKLLLTPNSSMRDILNHTYLIACKLDLHDLKAWCELEISGYNDTPDLDIPKYRVFFGSLYTKHCVTKQTQMHNIDTAFTFQVMKDGIYFFEKALASKEDAIDLLLKEDAEKLLRTQNPQLENHTLFLRFSKLPFQNVLDSVRFKILKISYELEKQGILGEEWEFTDQEKQMTQNVHYTIGNVGNMANHNENSTINQTSTNNVNIVKGDFNSLASNLRSHGVEEADIQELQTIIDVTPLPQSPNEYSPNLKAWIAKMVTKSIDGTWQVAVGAAGSLLATGLQQYFGILVG
ncbi:hypothetical protein HWI77_07990 [Acinetobacter venetianus]|uniref:AbiTii domain-containing protein n=1 Tax=Acinetobacter pittii TaxID=48296 RepID=A0AB33BM74_ACIPI|nr:hypothetical protein [Acinetobacter pittii]MDC5166968.1 hypothetical protein [Acinetobacter baumannii]QNH52643.1 hypothetical protein HWI77_07990 [Acinetobacter venetianus]AMX19478.1 hypothetical protein IEC338SC_2350 [Acinetobacter pittii]MDC5483534.1 hypothetical protein [Acinetobacter baumannii]PPC03684.1 hypothetical protein ApiMCR53_02540 [Acinetobacter pittii]